MARFFSKPVDNEYGHFDSKTEADYYEVLLKRQDKGEISELDRQRVFMLQEKFKMDSGEGVRKIEYISDFTYMENGQLVIVDAKGSIFNIEETFKIKFKLLKYIHKGCRFEIILKNKDIWYNIEDKEQKKAYKLSVKKKKTEPAKPKVKKSVSKKKIVKKTKIK